MGMQTLVLFIGLAIAMTVGVFAGGLEADGPLAGWLIIGVLPAMSALWFLTEWAIDRKIFHYTAPYPQHSMAVAEGTEISLAQTAAERERTVVGAEKIRLAA